MKIQFTKRMFLILAAVMLFGSMVTIQVNADSDAVEDKSFGDFTYTELEQENGEATIKITKYNGEDSVLTIPVEIDGKRVTSIASETFNRCDSIKNEMGIKGC